MQHKKRKTPQIKTEFHPWNKHRGRYDFQQLTKTCPSLAPFVKLNDYDDESIDFFDPEAVRKLNKAILQHYYDIETWDIPQNYLCPPIPGRADYIHRMADLLSDGNPKLLKGNKIRCFDIGVGASCIYPIIGVKEYGWSFVGTEIDPVAIESAKKIITGNAFLKGKVEIRQQENRGNIFHGVLGKEEFFDLVISNPPFHGSLEEAEASTKRKLKNLKFKKSGKPVLNFGGQSNELWCKGGEKRFVKNIITQSKKWGNNCFWFSSLVSKESNLGTIYKTLKKIEVTDVRTIPMGSGNKKSRIVAWTFQTEEQQQEWKQDRWK